MASISSAASRARVNKTACFYLSLQCNEVLRRFENGELGSKTDPKLNELVATLEKCRTRFTKFTGYGWLLRLIRSEDNLVSLNNTRKHWKNGRSQFLKWFLYRVERGGSASLTLRRRVSRRRKRPEDVPIINPGDLEVGGEVGKFSFEAIYMGIYNRELVYVRKVDEHIKGIPLDPIKGNVRLSGCLVGCHIVLYVHGICQGRMMVTETTTHGPLSDFSIKNTLKKVGIARKVADAINSTPQPA